MRCCSVQTVEPYLPATRRCREVHTSVAHTRDPRGRPPWRGRGPRIEGRRSNVIKVIRRESATKREECSRARQAARAAAKRSQAGCHRGTSCLDGKPSLNFCSIGVGSPAPATWRFFLRRFTKGGCHDCY